MTLEAIGSAFAIFAIISGGILFIFKYIASRTTHEITQDNKIASITNDREACLVEREAQTTNLVNRITRLEERDNERELLLVQVIAKIEHTQVMITQLTEHQQETFKALIETIKELGVNNKEK